MLYCDPFLSLFSPSSSVHYIDTISLVDRGSDDLTRDGVFVLRNHYFSSGEAARLTFILPPLLLPLRIS